MSKFSEMVKNLQEREGYSKEVATKTAAKIGREKYGAKGMAEKAAASRGKDAIPVQETVARPEPTNYTRFGPSLDGRNHLANGTVEIETHIASISTDGCAASQSAHSHISQAMAD